MKAWHRARALGLGLIAVTALVAACGGASPSAHGSAGCAAVTAPVDPSADSAAWCAAAALDSWHERELMGIGQQLNVSSTAFKDPLKALDPKRPALIGFDLAELQDAIEQGNDPTADLIALAKSGALLTATWHARNPQTGGSAGDRSWTDTAQLLGPKSVAYASFWHDWDLQLQSLRRFQDAGVAVILSPLHEAGGDWFWWGGMEPEHYRAVWAQLQERAARAGIHNLLWAFAAAPRTRPAITDPVLLLPHAVDLVGIDAYQQAEPGLAPALDLTDYRTLEELAPRMALTEVGPKGSDGSWTPAIITDTLRKAGLHPDYARLWFDDADGRKAVGSLEGGKAWLASCPAGLCSLKP